MHEASRMIQFMCKSGSGAIIGKLDILVISKCEVGNFKDLIRNNRSLSSYRIAGYANILRISPLLEFKGKNFHESFTLLCAGAYNLKCHICGTYIDRHKMESHSIELTIRDRTLASSILCFTNCYNHV